MLTPVELSRTGFGWSDTRMGVGLTALLATPRCEARFAPNRKPPRPAGLRTGLNSLESGFLIGGRPISYRPAEAFSVVN